VSGTNILSHRAVVLNLAARSLGTRGDGNGVEISNANLSGSKLGDEEINGKTVSIRLDLSDIARAEARGKTSGAGVLGHEVTHGIDDRRFGAPSSLHDVMARELRGYAMESLINQYIGYQSSLWYPGISTAERKTRVFDGAHRSCAALANEVQPKLFNGQNCLR